VSAVIELGWTQINVSRRGQVRRLGNLFGSGMLYHVAVLRTVTTPLSSSQVGLRSSACASKAAPPAVGDRLNTVTSWSKSNMMDLARELVGFMKPRPKRGRFKNFYLLSPEGPGVREVWIENHILVALLP
jgi:hypothetical protein